MIKTKSAGSEDIATRLAHAGPSPHDNHGFVNPPVFHGSTVLAPTLEAAQDRTRRYVYGRQGTPTTTALEQTVTDIEGAAGTVLTSSGLEACTVALLSSTKAGDHVLVADNVYGPTRRFCDKVLARFGVETTSLVAAIGAAAFAVGLALQGTLGNVAAGVMLVFFRPYSLGDFVEVGGVSGTVADINLFTTELNTPDNKTIIVPNGQAWGNVITNYSVKPTRRVDITFGISYDDDINKAMEVIRAHYDADERVLKDPEFFLGVIAHNTSSIDIVTRAWVKTPDYWSVYFDAMKGIKEAFDANGIEIPYPHQVEVRKKA